MFAKVLTTHLYSYSSAVKYQIRETAEYNVYSNGIHCVKCGRIRSYSGPHFPSFGLNTERHGVSLRIQSECGKMRSRITSNTDTFHAVIAFLFKIIKNQFIGDNNFVDFGNAIYLNLG